MTCYDLDFRTHGCITQLIMPSIRCYSSSLVALSHLPSPSKCWISLGYIDLLRYIHSVFEFDKVNCYKLTSLSRGYVCDVDSPFMNFAADLPMADRGYSVSPKSGGALRSTLCN